MNSHEDSDLAKIHQWIVGLASSQTRENALDELSKNRLLVLQFAPVLWDSSRAIEIMKQEMNSYRAAINSATLTAHQADQVCKLLSVYQCLTYNDKTRPAFFQARIHLFLYPFLQNIIKTSEVENLRLASLGVLGGFLLKGEQEIVTFLLTTEMIPLCLQFIESGSEIAKAAALFLIHKILQNGSGLTYMCQNDRLDHISKILTNMVISLATAPSTILLKHVVRCLCMLSANDRGREALRQCLPPQLKDDTFKSCFEEEKIIKDYIMHLLKNLEPGPLHTHHFPCF